ncbi:MAG: secondary thiamine-phosphate synthase enzyme YjbQ [Pseudomonadota bacterium]|nr:secondary thiamine-phosphate synthase enzyme YjbQ [Pseudomonadota bacterium]
MHVLHIDTTAREAMTDITPRLEELVRAGNIRSGLLFVYTPHTTTALTINEGADPDVRRDILSHLRALVPENASFLHAEGNSDAHVKASLFGSSVQVMVEEGRLLLGTWQRIFLCEFDGPRKRKIWVRVC